MSDTLSNKIDAMQRRILTTAGTRRRVFDSGAAAKHKAAQAAESAETPPTEASAAVTPAPAKK